MGFPTPPPPFQACLHARLRSSTTSSRLETETTGELGTLPIRAEQPLVIQTVPSAAPM